MARSLKLREFDQTKVRPINLVTAIPSMAKQFIVVSVLSRIELLIDALRCL